MRASFSGAALACALAAGLAAPGMRAQSEGPQVVISQIHGGGGNSGATYRNDFIELFNRGTQGAGLDGWSVQYASASGTAWQVTPLAGTIEPGQYFLVRQAAGAGGTADLPAADVSGSIVMSATAGKVALVRSAGALSGVSPEPGLLADLVGYGAANLFEGAPAQQLSNTRAGLRRGLRPWWRATRLSPETTCSIWETSPPIRTPTNTPASCAPCSSLHKNIEKTRLFRTAWMNPSCAFSRSNSSSTRILN